jgi:uncharacterized protein YndB with AHSA1/START domain
MAAIHVDAPAETVFEAISDLTRHAEWATHDLKIEAVDDSPLGVGKSYTSSHQGKAPDQVTVTELVPGQRFGFRSLMTNGLELSHTITVTQESGGALVTRDPKCTAAPGLKVIFRPLIALAAPMDAKKNLKAMKSVLEQSSG